jgi:hypothetical protein
MILPLRVQELVVTHYSSHNHLHILICLHFAMSVLDIRPRINLQYCHHVSVIVSEAKRPCNGSFYVSETNLMYVCPQLSFSGTSGDLVQRLLLKAVSVEKHDLSQK